MPVFHVDFSKVTNPDEHLWGYRPSWTSHTETLTNLSAVGGLMQFTGLAAVQPTCTIFPPIYGNISRLMLVFKGYVNGHNLVGEYGAIGFLFPYAGISIMIGHSDFDSKMHALDYVHTRGLWNSLGDVAQCCQVPTSLNKLQLVITRSSVGDFPYTSVGISYWCDGVNKLMNVRYDDLSPMYFHDVVCPIIMNENTGSYVRLEHATWYVLPANQYVEPYSWEYS